MRFRAGWTSIAAIAVALSTAAPLALGQGYDGEEPPTRKQWVRQADRICEDPFKRGNRLVDRFAKRADNERWGPAGEILIRLSKLVRRVVDRVSELEPPPADADEIETWLDAEERGAKLFKEAGRELKREKLRRAAKLLERSDKVVTKGHKAVKGFGLKECV